MYLKGQKTLNTSITCSYQCALIGEGWRGFVQPALVAQLGLLPGCNNLLSVAFVVQQAFFTQMSFCLLSLSVSLSLFLPSVLTEIRGEPSIHRQYVHLAVSPADLMSSYSGKDKRCSHIFFRQTTTVKSFKTRMRTILGLLSMFRSLLKPFLRQLLVLDLARSYQALKLT